MKALSANYFLKAFLQTFPMAYYTCPVHKNFTFQLPGKCAYFPNHRHQDSNHPDQPIKNMLKSKIKTMVNIVKVS